MRSDLLERIADSYSLDDVCNILGKDPIWFLKKIEKTLEANIELFDVGVD